MNRTCRRCARPILPEQAVIDGKHADCAPPYPHLSEMSIRWDSRRRRWYGTFTIEGPDPRIGFSADDTHPSAVALALETAYRDYRAGLQARGA